MPLRFETAPQSEIVQLVAPLPEVVRLPTGLPLAILLAFRELLVEPPPAVLPLAILSLAVMPVATMALA